MKLKRKFAFSLIELSISIIIISILMTAIIKGSDLINQAKINSARSKTANSPVLKINNLFFWLETSFSSSFTTSEIVNNGTITIWKDFSGNNPSNPNNATGTGAYIEDVLNGLPVIRFNGTSNFFTYNGEALANSNYTIFVVEQRRSNNSQSYFLGGTSADLNKNLTLGYRGDVTLTLGQYSNDCDAGVVGYTSPIPRIHSYTFNSSIGKTYFVNGLNQTISCNGNPQEGLLSYLGAQIGKYYTSYYYNGDIAEIIMFTRALSNQEREDIEDYLSDKYEIF